MDTCQAAHSTDRYPLAQCLWKEPRRQLQFSDHRSLSEPGTSFQVTSHCPVIASHLVNSYRLAHPHCRREMVSVNRAIRWTFVVKLRCRHASDSTPARPAPFGACLRPTSLVRSFSPSSTIPHGDREQSRHPSLSTTRSTCLLCRAGPFR